MLTSLEDWAVELDDWAFNLDDQLLADQSLTDTVLEEPTPAQQVDIRDPVDVGWLFSLRPGSFNRPVDWRWHLATQLVQGQALVPSALDQHVEQARDFQSLLADAGEADLECLAEWMPGLFAAHVLYRRGPDPLRYEVEARILAKEPFESIAEKCCLAVSVLEAYEALFFNVLDRLSSRGYIIHQVIGPKLHEGLKTSDIDVLWKFYGYHGGPLVLDQLIYAQTESDRPQFVADVRKFFDADIAMTVKQRVCLAVRTMRFDDPKSLRSILRLYRQLAELSQSRQKMSPQVDITLNLKVFNDEIDHLLGRGQAMQATL